MNSNERAKVLLFSQKAFANRTIRLSNRTNLHFRGILPPELERSLPRQLFEDAVESLIGCEATKGDSRRNGVMVRSVLRVRKDSFSALHPILRHKLRETEVRPSVDTSGDIRTVRPHRRGEVLDSKIRVRIEFIFAQNGDDFIE